MNENYYEIAAAMAEFMEDFDTYGYRDAYADTEEATEDAAALLMEGKAAALESFRAIYEDSKEDMSETLLYRAQIIEKQIEKYVE